MARTPAFRPRSREQGFSLVELMIAMLIALFLLGGLVMMVMGTRRSGASQTALTQLQDNQRIAMTLITNIVQKAGYFSDPTTQQVSTSFASETFNGVTMAAGQVIGGTYVAGVPDTFEVRFLTPPLDSTNANAAINCAGQTNTVNSTNVEYNNEFLIGTVNGTSWLQCQTRTNNAGTLSAVLTLNLIPNVTNLSVLYGVSATPASSDFSVVQYLNASQMSAVNWNNITAVKVTLTFRVPVYGTTGGQMSTTQTQTFQRVIPVMSRAGVQT